MPYSRDSNFNPDPKYRSAWSQTPQNLKISVSGYEAPSMYSTLSSSIPIFYVLMVLAIIFDFYLGFSVLAKSGVNIMLIIGAILFDFVFAVVPVLLAPFTDIFKHTYIENKIFASELKLMSKHSEEARASHNDSVLLELKRYKSKKVVSKLISLTLALLIFAIAGWKIFTYYSVLPPGMSIFSMVNGKIVIIFSFLCAVFHLIGSEKALAHFNFWRINKSQYNTYVRRGVKAPEIQRLPLEVIGDYKPAKSGNTAVVIDEDGKAYIEYNHIIWDDEIINLIQKQTDENAKRGIAIKCKENQL